MGMFNNAASAAGGGSNQSTFPGTGGGMGSAASAAAQNMSNPGAQEVGGAGQQTDFRDILLRLLLMRMFGGGMGFEMGQGSMGQGAKFDPFRSMFGGNAGFKGPFDPPGTQQKQTFASGLQGFSGMPTTGQSLYNKE